jgi:hypothetical protein
LKAARPDVTVIMTEPEGAQILAGKEWKPHQIQGWTPDFVPAVLDREVYDRIVPVSDVEARATARALDRRELGRGRGLRPPLSPEGPCQSRGMRPVASGRSDVGPVLSSL